MGSEQQRGLAANAASEQSCGLHGQRPGPLPLIRAWSPHGPHLFHYFLPLEQGGFPGGSAGRECTCNAGDLGLILGWEDPLKKGKATHSSILAWRIPWTV